ncbi:MAG: hypothetical protein NC036_03440 [Muribaculaceae bacterium]|nr:hypothetical protein [Muribaculaceae bacterium]
MKKTLLALATVVGLGTMTANAQWQKVTSASELREGVEYVIGAPHLKWVMSTSGDGAISRYGVEASYADRNTIEGTPEGAAIFTIQYAGQVKGKDTYAFKQINGTQTGYLAPGEVGRRSLTLTSDPTPLTIKFLTASQAAARGDSQSAVASIFAEGDVDINDPSRDKHDLLGLFKINQFEFQFLEDSNQPVAIYKKVGQTGNDLLKWTLDPANGTVVDDITSWIVEFPEDSKVKFSNKVETTDDWAGSVTCSTPGVDIILNPTCTGRNQFFQFSFRQGNMLATPGTYTFRIPEGFLDITLANGTVIPNPAIVGTLVIPEIEPTFTFTPSTGSKVKEISSFALDFGNIISWDLNDEMDDTWFTATKDNVVIATKNMPRCTWDTKQNHLTFNYPTPVTEAGTYVYSFKAGLFKLTMANGTVKDSPALNLTLIIEGNTSPTDYVLFPANNETVKSFTNMSISFPNAQTTELLSTASVTVTTESKVDISKNFVLRSSNNNTFTFAFQADPDLPALADGTYKVVFGKDSFKVDGTTMGEISFNFSINSKLVEGDTFRTYVTGSFPQENAPMILSQTDFGMNEVIYTTTEALKINRACTGKIQLVKGGKILMEIPATATYKDEAFAEVSEGSAGFGGGGTVTLRFGSDMRDEDGLYTVKVPADFFMDGDTKLGAANFNYTIGIGTFTPTAKVSLSDPSGDNASVVFDKALSIIKLLPYDSKTVLNETTFREAKNDDDGLGAVSAIAIQGADASAVLYRVDGKNKEQVATFPLNSPKINAEGTALIDGTTPAGSLPYYRNGYIYFDLRNGGLEPIKRNGDYVLEMPWNFFRTQLTDDTYATWKEFENLDNTPGTYKYNFTVTGGIDANAPVQKYTYTPAAGSYNPFPTVTLTYEGCENVVVNEGAQATLWFGSTNPTEAGKLNITSDGNKVILTPVTPITKQPASEYTAVILEVPASSYNLVYNGKEWANEEVKINDLKMSAPQNTGREPKFSFDTNNVTAKDLESFTITFEDTPKSWNISGSVKLYYNDDTRTEVLVNTYSSKKVDNNSKTYTLKTPYQNGITALYPGNYRLELSSGLVYWTDDVDGKSTRVNLPKTSINLVVKGEETGVDGVEAEALYTVYTLTGIRVFQNVEAETLKTLAPGLYIINGKKVLVK